MAGYCYGEDPPVESCPYCGAKCDADFVDIGVGFTQCGPYHCEICGASEIGPYDKDRPLSEQENKTGWYGPGQEPGSSANVVHGKIVSHQVMKETYQEEFKGNPLWHDKSYVEKWWEKIRK